ncbi:hypothetical protein J2Y38_004573 [Flavobacterium sp. 2755]|uniref:T9SS sorting signal type C domain-containing protein n=1 Tax=Flavobacterium sp. 2755 TaxID=2817765 RepID=UPI002865F90C|nr:T9SS sorting signal type C domain-containing protein [Flavobacterium sp. 2755]MDR6764340.1 hypothetical protein [Flavobacterium sp. 2755]
MKKLFPLPTVFFSIGLVLLPNFGPVRSAVQNPVTLRSLISGTVLEEERHRVWLNLTNTQGLFKQILIGYVPGATNGWDQNYDALTMDANPYADFYSINEERKLVVQGRAVPFDTADAVPLGYRSAITGDLTISIDHADGDFLHLDVYLEDKQTGSIHNLKNGGYTFSTQTGTFQDRFVIRYNDKTLGTNDPKIITRQISVAVKDKAIQLKSYQAALKEVCVFDISGKLLYRSPKTGTSELEITSIKSGPQMLLVKITLEDGYTLTRKILF